MSSMAAIMTWACFGTVLAAIASAISSAIVRKVVHRETLAHSDIVIRVARFPFLLVLYYAVMTIPYGGICTLRGVDPGIGDGWVLPLGHDYQLYMIDIPNHGFISLPHSHNDIGEITTISQVGTIVAGGLLPFQFFRDHVDPQTLPDPSRFFLLDTATGALSYFPTESALQQAAAKLGVPAITLQPIETFYGQRRWNWIDFAWVIVIQIVPLYYGVGLIRQIRHLRRESRQVQAD